MTNAERLLAAVDERLNGRVELTLYGRAALHLGFPNPPKDYALMLAAIGKCTTPALGKCTTPKRLIM